MSLLTSKIVVSENEQRASSTNYKSQDLDNASTLNHSGLVVNISNKEQCKNIIFS